MAFVKNPVAGVLAANIIEDTAAAATAQANVLSGPPVPLESSPALRAVVVSTVCPMASPSQPVSPMPSSEPQGCRVQLTPAQLSKFT